MSPELAAACIDFLEQRASPNAFVAIYGGEPLIEWKTLENVVRRVRRPGGPMARNVLKVMTNGSLLTERRIDFLLEHEVSFVISLDGPADIHNRMRRFRHGQPTHQRVLKSLQRLHARGPAWYRRNVNLNCLLSSANLEALWRIHRYFDEEDILRDMTVTPIGLQRGFEPERAADLDLSTKPAWTTLELTEAFLQVLASSPGRPTAGLIGECFLGQMGILGQRRPGFADPNMWPAGMCYPGKERLYIGADGRFYVCNNLDIPDARIGDIDHGFDYARVRAIIETFLDYYGRACQDCWAFRLCGACPVHGKSDGHMSVANLARWCVDERKRCLQRLRGFVHVWTSEEKLGLADHAGSLHSRVARMRAQVPDS